MSSFNMRKSERFECSLHVDLVHPVVSQKGRVVDLSLTGAKIEMATPYPVGANLVIDYEGHSAWAMVRWAEEDRVGVSFEIPLGSDHPFLRELRRPAANSFAYPQRPVVFGRRAA